MILWFKPLLSRFRTLMAQVICSAHFVFEFFGTDLAKTLTLSFYIRLNKDLNHISNICVPKPCWNPRTYTLTLQRNKIFLARFFWPRVRYGLQASNFDRAAGRFSAYKSHYWHSTLLSYTRSLAGVILCGR